MTDVYFRTYVAYILEYEDIQQYLTKLQLKNKATI